MFPVAVRAVRELRPKAFIFENVKGLTRGTFSNYFQYIQLQLTHPEVIAEPGEAWTEHLARLEKHHTSGGLWGLKYNVVARLLNAADFGVPQVRERVFVVGFRSDLGLRWSFPDATHSMEALLRDQFGTGDYWERHSVGKSDREQQRSRIRKDITKAIASNEAALRPWRTVRDAIADLPMPKKKTPNGILNHVFQAGARPYPGHTGSPLDLPAKTLKAGDHGVPGGENMIAMPDGSYRYFTVRESARLQTFPDGYLFHGSWTETMRQLGNAVPVRLAHVVGASVARQLLSAAEMELGRQPIRKAG